MNSTVVREIHRAKINPKPSLKIRVHKICGAQITRENTVERIKSESEVSKWEMLVEEMKLDGSLVIRDFFGSG
jgi:hypothetical protein